MITLQEIHERDKRPPSVSVYMICYNHAKYVDKAIKGVLMQKTDFPVNIVIHDDASPDGSGEIIRRYASENPNITAIIEETNYYQNGKSFFHKMLPHLTGKYIAFCECDDFWIDEHKLQIQVDYLESNPDCVAVYSNILPVNKYGVHDENARREKGAKRGFEKTGEGDYPYRKFPMRGVQGHQLATLVMRNFYSFMTPDEMAFYCGVRAVGDFKIRTMLTFIGRVHYFSQEFAAYRRVTDEGDSWSARIARMSEYDVVKIWTKSDLETYRMMEYFFGGFYFRKYIYILWRDLIMRKEYHWSVIRDIPLPGCYQYRNIPWFIWPVFGVYVSYRAAKKVIKSVMPKILLTWIRKVRYNLLSALCSLLSALC